MADKRERLTLNQQSVLNSLYGDDRTIAMISYDWPWMGEASARAAVRSLEKRRMVEAVKMQGSARVWGITAKGAEAIDNIGLLSF